MLASQNIINEIMLGFSVLQHYVKISNSTNLTDINIHTEILVSNILNSLYQWNLQSTNRIITNYPCIDLVDPVSRIGVQISSDNKSSKINETLDCLTSNQIPHKIDRLKVFLLIPKQKSYTVRNKCIDVAFDQKKDIIDFSNIIKHITNTNDPLKINSIHAIVTKSMPNLFSNQSETLNEQAKQLRNGLSLFDRELLHAPFSYENPVEMYRAIREIRIKLQQGGASRIPNLVASKSFQDIHKILRDCEYRVRDLYPFVVQAASSEAISFQIDTEEFMSAIRMMMGIRSKIFPLIHTIEAELERLDAQIQ